MAVIGSLQFCDQCGNLLPPPKGLQQDAYTHTCECCAEVSKDRAKEAWVITKTKDSDFPSTLRQKLSEVQAVARHEINTERMDANTDCPKCGVRGVRYSEVQARSADEGSTILYNCTCGHRWSINN